MNKYLSIAGLVAVALGASATYANKTTQELQAEYILQGANKATIVDNVGSVGGTVVHEYSVIEAVSVKLSNTQLIQIKKLNPMLRPFKGQDVNVSSVINSFNSDNIEFNLKKKTATWIGVNSSNDLIMVDSINLNMPSVNKQIKSIKINGKKIKAKNVGFNGSVYLSDKEQFTLGAGEALRVELKFKEINTVEAGDYQLSFSEIVQNNNDESQTDENDSEEDTQASQSNNDDADDSVFNGKLGFDFDDKESQWKVVNNANYVKAVDKLTLAYPLDNEGIVSLKVNDEPVDFSVDENSDLVLTVPFELEIEESLEIEVGFVSLSSADTTDYSLIVHFNDGLAQNVVVPAHIEGAGDQRDTHYPSMVRANLVHERGITGYGVTVAILDTGIRDLRQIKETASGGDREITIVDVLGTSTNKGQAKKNDANGHGTHLASIITNSSLSYDEDGNAIGGYNGIAPDVNLVVLKAFDEEGHSSYTSILTALEYVVENKDIHNIKVLNLSFSAMPSSYYWDDPLNQALMKAWEAGITVVAAAGNRGPEAMTIGVPGNTPYVITVGAVSDNYTPSNWNDDFVATFSSAGPTVEGFVKPEVVAPGGHIQGVMDKTTKIRETYAIFNDADMDVHNYFEMSGSSQSTAVTSGIVALMLQANPNLSPDDIKCRLMETAKLATTDTGNLAFSVFQQGAGLVDAMAAIDSTAMGCGNVGLSLAQDLSGEAHFIGPAKRHDNEGDYYIPGIEGLEWSGVYSDSQLWRNTRFNSDSQLWRNTRFDSDSQLWRNTRFDSDSQLWRNTRFDSDSQLWRNTRFDSDSQLWRNTRFNSDSIVREWVNHE